MGKKDKGGFKSLIEHIKQEIISSTGKPIVIREDTLLDKILSEEVEDINLTVEEAEKKLKKAKAKLNDDAIANEDAHNDLKVAKAKLDEVEKAYKKAEESGQGIDYALLANKKNAEDKFEAAESAVIAAEKIVEADNEELVKRKLDLVEAKIEAKKEREDTEKGLLWPPYYHYKDKWWSYLGFVKNPKNLSEVLKEKGKEIDHYEKDCLVLIEKKGNDSPSGDKKISYDKYPIIQTFWRFIKRVVRFLIWLFYVFVGALFSVFRGNFKSLPLCVGVLLVDFAGVLVFYQLLKLLLAGGKFVMELIAKFVIECVRPLIDSLIEKLNSFFGWSVWSNFLIWLVVVVVGVILLHIFYRNNNKNNESKDNDKIAGNKDENYPLDNNQAEGEKENGKEIEAPVNEPEETTNKVNKTGNVQDNRRWQKTGSYIVKNDLDASRWRRPNAVVLFLCFILFIYFVISTVLFFVRDVVFFQPRMSITESGVVKMTQPCGVEQYLFVHSSAELWKNTGISVVKDDVIEVNYSGAFYSTIRDMDKSAVLRTPPRYRLMNSRQYGDGYGDDFIVRYCVYNDSDARLGQLLLQITPPGQDPQSWVGDSLIDAVDFSDGKYHNLFSAKKSGTLMVAVNDVYLKKERIKEMLDSIDNEHLRCELLNHALYPMTSERLSSQSEKLTSEITDSVTSRFLYPPKKLVFFEMIRYSLLGQAIQDRNKKIKKELDKLFIKNEKIQHTHNLIRALVTCGDSIKIKSDTTIYSQLINELQNDSLLTAKNIYNYIDSLWRSSFNIIKTHYETVRFVEKMSDGTNINIDSITPLICDISRNNQKSKKNIKIVDSIIKEKGFNNIVLKDGCAVYVNNPDTEIKRDNLYAILFKYYIPQRDKILNKLETLLNSQDQLKWEEDAQDFWYSDNAGDLLVSVRVSRNDIPWHMKIVRFIDQKFERYGSWTFVSGCFVILVILVILYIDNRIGNQKKKKQFLYHILPQLKNAYDISKDEKVKKDIIKKIIHIQRFTIKEQLLIVEKRTRRLKKVSVKKIWSFKKCEKRLKKSKEAMDKIDKILGYAPCVKEQINGIDNLINNLVTALSSWNKTLDKEKDEIDKIIKNKAEKNCKLERKKKRLDQIGNLVSEVKECQDALDSFCQKYKIDCGEKEHSCQEADTNNA